MAKKYLTPDFDVTVYEIKDLIAGPVVGEGDADEGEFDDTLSTWYGDLA